MPGRSGATLPTLGDFYQDVRLHVGKDNVTPVASAQLTAGSNDTSNPDVRVTEASAEGTLLYDDFGTPRSHGCVNLAPIDAAWLFNWTTPEVPAAWHGALSLRKGTLVHTHP